MKAIIFINAGTIIKDEKTGWRTTNFEETDNFGVMGDRLRVEAAYLLYQKMPDSFLVCTAGIGQLVGVPEVVPVKAVIKKELIELGVPEERILVPGDAGNTYQELLELEKIIKSDKEIEQIIFVSNRWHIQRVQAIAEAKFNKFEDYRIKTEFISVEDYLIERDPEKWTSIVNQAYSSELMKKRLAMEQKGVEQVKNRTYNFK